MQPDSPESSLEIEEPTEGDSGSSDTEMDTSSSGDDPAPPSAIDGRPCPPDAFVDAQSFGMPFMSTWCASCHAAGLTGDDRRGAPADLNLDTHDAIREQLERVYARAGDEHDTMPPAGGPTPDERVLLGDWLACGAP